MTLLCDELNGVYVWIVYNDNEILEISPHFDYEEDAIAWRDSQNSEPTGPQWLN
jgi:hypothetical protein